MSTNRVIDDYLADIVEAIGDVISVMPVPLCVYLKGFVG